MQIIVDKAREAEVKEEAVVKVLLQQIVSAGIHKKFPTCTLKEVLFHPKYEKLTLLFYIIFTPFIIGHLFLFTYVSHFNFSVYTAVNAKNNMFLTCCMGYEIFTILFLILLAIFSLRQVSKNR